MKRADIKSLQIGIRQLNSELKEIGLEIKKAKKRHVKRRKDSEHKIKAGVRRTNGCI